MTDYIEVSIRIYEWLKSLGIKFDVEKGAPYIYKCAVPVESCAFHNEHGEIMLLPYAYEFVCSANVEPICPYFGPGGSSNSMAALRALEKKNMGWRLAASNEMHEECGPDDEETREALLKDGSYKTPHWRMEGVTDHTLDFFRWGETDGLVLHELLVQLMEGRPSISEGTVEIKGCK